MIAIVTVLLCLPLGWFVRSRLVANTTYAVAYLWAFVFQTLYLSLAGSAFSAEEFPWSYGLVTAGVFAVGFGLIAGAHEGHRRLRPDAGMPDSDLVEHSRSQREQHASWPLP